MEIWKPLQNFPSYDVSTEGRVRNIKSQRILQTSGDTHGYIKVCLHKNGKQHTVKVARLVAETFLGGQPRMDVRYKDDNRSNVSLDNLYWSNRKNTIHDAFYRGTKRPSRQTPVRILETGEKYESVTACANAIGCCRSDIFKCLAGTLSHVKGLHFERV